MNTFRTSNVFGKSLIAMFVAAILAAGSLLPATPAQAALPATVSCSGGGSVEISATVVRNGHWCVGSVEIPEGVTSIGQDAFYRSPGLESVVLPISLTSIEDRAFREASKLNDVIFTGVSLTTIGSYAFSGTSQLNSINLPNGLVGIGALAFEGSGITNIEIPSSVSSLGENPAAVRLEDLQTAFYGARSLVSIGVKTGNTTYSSRSGVLFSSASGGLIVYPAASSRTTYTVPSGTRYLYPWSFVDATNLKVLNIPSDIETIFPNAFINTSSMEEFNVTWDPTAGEPPTRYLSHANFNGVDILQGALYDFANYAVEHTAVLIAYPSAKPVTDYAIPGYILADPDVTTNFGNPPAFYGVTGIAAEAFRDAKNLKNIQIPASVTAIEDFAFAEVASLENINVDSSSTYVKSIDGVLLNGLGTGLIAYPTGSKRTSYAIPATVREIMTAAFVLNPYLQEVTIPSSVQDVGSAAFYGVSKLNTVTYLTEHAPTTENFGTEVFDGVMAGAIIRVKSTAGFGAYGTTWHGLIVSSEYASFYTGSGSSSEGSTVVVPVVPPVPVVTASVSKQIKLESVLIGLAKSGVPHFTGASASSPIEFAQGSMKLDEVDLALLNSMLSKYAGKKGTLVVIGFTKESSNGKSKDLKAATARAKGVTSALINLAKGLTIQYVGYGARNKLKPKAMDNRVEIRWIPSA